MRTLIVYYSFTGNNDILANDLKKRLSCDLLKIEETKKRTGFTILLDIVFNRDAKLKPHKVSLLDYDNFIFMAPIWAGRLAAPLKTFLKNNRKEIRRYSFITVCGGVEGQKEKLTGKLIKLLHRSPEIVTELWVADLFTGGKKGVPVNTTGYRMAQKDLVVFEDKIQEFIKVNQAKAQPV